MDDLVVIVAQSLDEMAELCYPHPRAGKLLGCSFHFFHSVTSKPRCYVYIAPEFWLAHNGVTVEQVRRHELAHCNGWPGDHPR
jgi:hypothetical protein